MTALLTDHLPLLAGAPNGIKKLRELILELAVRGRLVPQDASDEPASELLKRIAAEKKRLVAEGGIKQSKALIEIEKKARQFEVPAGWEWVSFDAIASTRLGKMLDKAKNKGVLRQYLRNTNVQWCRFELDDIKCMRFEEHELSEYGVQAGDLVICEGGEPGRCAVWQGFGEDLFLQKALHRARPWLGVSAFFLQLYLRASCNSGFLGNYFTGATIKHLSGEKLAKCPVPLPPLAEQRRIVAKVDELMALCDRLEARQADAASARTQLVEALLGSLTQSRDADDFATSWQRLSDHFHTLFTTESSIDVLKQTVLQFAVMGKLVPQDSSDEPASHLVKRIRSKKADLFHESRARRQKELVVDALPDYPYDVPSGWQWETVDALLHVTGGVTLGRKFSGRNVVSMPYLRVANVQRGYLDINQVKDVDVPDEEIEKYILRDGDLLITEGGDWDKVGRTAIWRSELPQCLHQNHVFRARAVTTEWEPRWAETYLNSSAARSYFAGSSKQTTNLASINMTQLRGCAFPVPPLPEQHRIVAKVDQLMALCDQLKSRMVQARELSQELTKAMIQKALEADPASRSYREMGGEVVHLASYLVSKMSASSTFGRVALMKGIYLADRHLGLELVDEYEREAAGPFAKVVYKVEHRATERGWFSHSTTTSVNERVAYTPGKNIKQATDVLREALGEARAELDRLIALLANKPTDDVEMIATLYAVWADALEKGVSIDDDLLVTGVRNWHESKRRFPPKTLKHWLAWMRENDLVPTETKRHAGRQSNLKLA